MCLIFKAFASSIKELVVQFPTYKMLLRFIMKHQVMEAFSLWLDLSPCECLDINSASSKLKQKLLMQQVRTCKKKKEMNFSSDTWADGQHAGNLL